MRKPKEIQVEDSEDGGGGNYWSRSLGAIITAFKGNNNHVISERLEGLLRDYNEPGSSKQTKLMHGRNIEILERFIDFDFSEWRPAEDLSFLPKPSNKSIIEVNNVPVQIMPSHVYAYGEESNRKIGAIWFVVWKDGFKSSDLGLFAEALYLYLKVHHSKEYQIDNSECKAIDLSTLETVSYDQVSNGDISSVINSTLIDINSQKV